ncbi:hypothetical protein FW781_19000 [Chryseobacterium panacisoli]|uniref:HTH luxR-type domain-containing protein n=1 Tax=Chryseobacterium panacisoli TaxID=1807141 RepID=A0A5D8ZFK3_9FLAO|nr:hypothetical protein [Chryseobacterium panacisoli]TZF93775.1 hypothetical protein FW781_19000 [Chryseobacterium panacisoli]
MKNNIFCILTLFFSLLNGQKIDQRSIDSLWVVTKDKDAYSNKGTKEMLRLCTEIYYQSKSINYEEGELRSLVKMSEIYINEQNYKESLNKISEGLILAEKNENYVIWSDFLRLQSTVYTKIGYYKKADKNSRKALFIADKIKENDSRYIVKSNAYRKIAENIEQENILKNKYNSVQIYFYKAYEETKKISQHFPRRNIYIARNVKNLAKVFYYQNKIPEAEKYLDRFVELTKDVKKSPEYISFYILKGNIENKKRNYKKAIEFFNKSIAFSQEYKILPAELIESYSGIAESYKRLRDYKNEADYLDKAKKISDSLSFMKSSLVEKVGKSEKEAMNTYKSTTYFIIGLGLIILALLIIFIKKRKNIKNLFFERNKYKVADNPDTMTINPPEIKQNNKAHPQDLNYVIELAKNNNHTFYLTFSELFPTFNQKLLEVSPQLTPSDLEYCALMKLNFDTKQIATFKKSSIGSVETRKSRIRKKLNIKNSENIYTWLMKM